MTRDEFWRIIDETVQIRGGALEVPNEKTGLTNIYASAWRTGGTEKQTGDQMDEYLEDLSYEELLGEDFLESEADDEIESDALRRLAQAILPSCTPYHSQISCVPAGVFVTMS